MTSRDLPLTRIQFFLTPAYPCSYVEGRDARSMVAAPSDSIDGPVYGELINMGFRRSGHHTYRPHCDACRACVPVRIPVDAFAANRSQRRNWERNRGLVSDIRELQYEEEHYQLYRRYQASRHAGGGMDQDDRDQYSQFLLQSHVDSFLIEFREEGKLRMVSLVDRVRQGLSAVYTFYEPDEPKAGYGVYNILWQVALCRELGLPYLYLGYWIAESRKMAYKTGYRPLEGLVDGTWREL